MIRKHWNSLYSPLSFLLSSYISPSHPSSCLPLEPPTLPLNLINKRNKSETCHSIPWALGSLLSTILLKLFSSSFLHLSLHTKGYFSKKSTHILNIFAKTIPYFTATLFGFSYNSLLIPCTHVFRHLSLMTLKTGCLATTRLRTKTTNMIRRSKNRKLKKSPTSKTWSQGILYSNKWTCQILWANAKLANFRTGHTNIRLQGLKDGQKKYSAIGVCFVQLNHDIEPPPRPVFVLFLWKTTTTFYLKIPQVFWLYLLH